MDAALVFLILIPHLLLFFFSLVDFSIIGAIIIVSGLYTVVWGKSKDGKNAETDEKSNALQELPITYNARSISVDNGIDEPIKIVNIPASKSPFNTQGT